MGLTFFIVQSMLLEQTLWQASSVFSTFNSILRMMVPNDSIDQEFTLYTKGEQRRPTCAKSVMDLVVVVTVRTQRGQQPLSWHLDVSQFMFFNQTAIICRSLGIIGHRIRLKLLNALHHASVLTLGRFYPPRLGPPVAAQTAHHRCWIPAVQLCFRLRRFSPHFMPGTMVARWRFISLFFQMTQQ